ncbi:MAG: hypothetical protein IH946_12260 [Bacteroidetes bacterium]|nr:hypothetical protein [Bacteroidota bacterium]
MKTHPKFEIYWKVVRDKETFFESDTKYEIQVIHTTTRKVVLSYGRSEYDNSEGSFEKGAKEVNFSSDGKNVIIDYENGDHEEVALPEFD